MRSLALLLAVASLAIAQASSAMAQPCEALGNCKPDPKPATVRRHDPPKPDPGLVVLKTVYGLEKEFAGPPRRILAGADWATKPAQEVNRAIAAYLKTSKFKRNPVQSSDSVGVVLDGLDVVALLEDKQGIVGPAASAVAWDGAIWLFSTPQNQQKFLSDPKRYAPPYGGHCAYCLAIDHVASPDTKIHETYKGRVYLFSTDGIRTYWRDNKPDEWIAKADSAWPVLPANRLNTTMADTAITTGIKQAMEQN